jgi:CDP-2,3-bis-(O-geranylgeranyl)-sn-glycerol synthase
MEQYILLLLQAFWFIAPAYAANAFPPLMRGKTPIDRKKIYRGARLLGDGKTVEGFWGGIIFGVFIGSIQIFGQTYIPKELGLNEMTFPIVLMLSLGTMAGDLIGSFLKRRMGMKRGESAFLMDQLGFLIMAFIFTAPFYIPGIPVIVVLIILTPLIHWFANILGYWIKVKRHPW